MENDNVFRFMGNESIKSKADAMAFAIKVSFIYKDGIVNVDFDLAKSIYKCFTDNLNLPDAPQDITSMMLARSFMKSEEDKKNGRD